jgi:DNA-binding CsgD family transcriptional regulator
MDLVQVPSSLPQRLHGFIQQEPAVISSLELVRLASLWNDLVGGACRVERSELADDTCSFSVSPRPGGREPLSYRDRSLLEHSLLEGVRKVVAQDFSMCPSTMAANLQRIHQHLGLNCRPSRVPLLAVLAAHASHLLTSPAQPIQAERPEPSAGTVSASWPREKLSSRVSPAECAVTQLLLAGNSYREIATMRGTSVRTVANQLASVFRELNVSGRSQLLCLLASAKLAAWQRALESSACAFGSRGPAGVELAG